MAGIKRRIEDEFGLARSNPVHPEKLRKTLNNVREELQDIVSTLDDGRKKRPENSPVSAIMRDPVRDVAQPGSAHAWGAWGRRFESARPDHFFPRESSR